MSTGISSSSSCCSKKVVLECAFNENWAVCWSSKRHQLYFYSKNSKKSFWEKPNHIVLTDHEQNFLKDYEKMNGDTKSDNITMDTSDCSNFEECKKHSDQSYNMCQNGTFETNDFYFSKKSENVMKTKASNGSYSHYSNNKENSSFKTPPLKYKSPLHMNRDTPSEIQKKSCVVNIVDDKIHYDNTIENVSDMNEACQKREASDLKTHFSKRNNESECSLYNNYTLPKHSIVLTRKKSPDKKCDSLSEEQSRSNEIKTFYPQRLMKQQLEINKSVTLSDGVKKQLKQEDSYAVTLSGGVKKQLKQEDSYAVTHFDGVKKQLKQEDSYAVTHFDGVKKQLKQKDSCAAAVKPSNVLPKNITDPSTSINVTETNSKRKRKKKRQYRRLGYWYNKRAKAELLMTAVNNKLDMIKSSSNIIDEDDRPNTTADDDMDWEDAFTTAVSKIAESKMKSLENLQPIISKEYLFKCPKTKPHLLIVVDTKILLQHYRHIVHFINCPPSEFPAAYVMPYDVLTQLDLLKYSKESSFFQKRLRDVISFIQKMLFEGNPRFIGQTAEDSKIQMDPLLDLDIFPQSIINCCLQYQRKGFNVVLYTSDKSLISCAKTNNIERAGNKDLLKEIKILSTMSKCGFLDETELWADKSKNDEQTDDSQIPMYVLDIITNHLDVKLQEYLSLILQKAMFKMYGNEYFWQNRFLIKPPWKIREICLNMKQHWSVITNSFISKEISLSLANISRLMTDFRKIRWTENTVGELLDLLRAVTTKLHDSYPEETNAFNNHLSECDAIYKKELNTHKLLITTPAALLETEFKIDTESIFYYVLSKLRNKREQFFSSLNWNPSIDIDSKMLPQLQKSSHNLLLHVNSAMNILKGIEGMLRHESVIINIEEPFVAYFMIGLQSIIMLDDVSNQTNLSNFQVTPQSVIDFFLRKKNNSGSLKEIFNEVQNISKTLTELMNFVCTKLQNKGFILNHN